MAGLRITFGSYRGQPVAITVCGMGKVNAARVAQVLCSTYRPRLLLISGGAGALAPDLQVGDVVVASAVVQHDLGAWTAQGYWPAGCGATWTAAPELVRRLSGREGTRPHVGVICSGDQVVAEAGKRAELARQFGALAVDMESAGLAQVATANGIPWLAIRGISDAVADNEALSLELPLAIAPLNLAGALEVFGGFAAHLAGRPRRVAQLWTFLRRFRKAAQAAAAVTLEVVAGQ